MSSTWNFGTAVVLALVVSTLAWGIEPANSNATQDARRVLTYLYELPKRSENRIVSGHLAGGAVGPHVREGKSPYRFTMQEIDYLHRVSGQWIGLIGADSTDWPGLRQSANGPKRGGMRGSWLPFEPGLILSTIDKIHKKRAATTMDGAFRQCGCKLEITGLQQFSM